MMVLEGHREVIDLMPACCKPLVCQGVALATVPFDL